MKKITGLIILLAALLIVPAISATAQQKALLNIENSSGETVMHVYNDSGLLVTGNFNAGFIPAEGAGVRLMWYPYFAAFRAGRVTGTQWDVSNIGTYSVAMGYNTKANGHYSTALGYSTIASGIYSTALGRDTEADGSHSTALGRGTKASAFGSTAMGVNTEANGRSSTAMGRETIASGEYSTAIGYNTKAQGNGSIAMGRETIASGDYSTAIGFNTKAQGYGSIAMGRETSATGYYSTATGHATNAAGDMSTAMGEVTVAGTDFSLSIGRYNSANVLNDGTLFVVGNGDVTSSSRSDALVLDGTGDLWIAGNLTQASDMRLKTDIEQIGEVLDRVLAIDAFRYRFKPGAGHPKDLQIGLSAQQVQKAFPVLVEENGRGYLSVSYSKFTAILLKAIQEQQKIIDGQQVQIKKLGGRMQELEEALKTSRRLMKRVIAMEVEK